MFLEKILPLFQAGKIDEGFILAKKEGVDIEALVKERYGALFDLMKLKKSVKIKKKVKELFTSKSLDFSERKLKTFPIEILDCIQLTNLNLRNNQLTEIPLGIIEMKSLKQLNLDGNNLFIFFDEHPDFYKHLSFGGIYRLDHISYYLVFKKVKLPDRKPIDNYEERQQPAINKPWIDEALLRMIKCTTADLAAAQGILNSLEATEDADTYLKKAISSLKTFFTSFEMHSKLGGGRGRLLLKLISPDNDGWFELEYYPKEAHAFLKKGNFIEIQDADIIGRWKRKDRVSYHHAHMEGFWTVAEDAIDLIEQIAYTVEQQ